MSFMVTHLNQKCNLATELYVKVLENQPTLKRAACGEPNSINGGFPVAISTTVQPKDQTSAGAA